MISKPLHKDSLPNCGKSRSPYKARNTLCNQSVARENGMARCGSQLEAVQKPVSPFPKYYLNTARKEEENIFLTLKFQFYYNNLKHSFIRRRLGLKTIHQHCGLDFHSRKQGKVRKELASRFCQRVSLWVEGKTYVTASTHWNRSLN